MKSKPMSWAYLAGFFDGEGSIVARWSTNRHGGKSLRPIWQVGQNEENSWVLDEIIDFLQGIEGVKIPRDNVWVNNGFSRKRFRRLSLEDAESVRIVLKGMLPYLIVKRGMAERIYAFLEKRKKLIQGNWSYANRAKVTAEAESMMEEVEKFLNDSTKGQES